jgi:hypothetical protein
MESIKLQIRNLLEMDRFGNKLVSLLLQVAITLAYFGIHIL